MQDIENTQHGFSLYLPLGLLRMTTIKETLGLFLRDSQSSARYL